MGLARKQLISIERIGVDMKKKKYRVNESEHFNLLSTYEHLFIADVERKCAECINTVDCPYSGHQPFLRVDKESGFTYVVADRERCYKYHPLVPDVVPKRSACRQGDLAKV